MRDTWPLLEQIAFPPIRRGRLDTLQVNLGYRCNQSCVHCHVNAGPNRTEEMSSEVVDVVLAFLARKRVATLDITGGAPELNPHFRKLVRAARKMDVQVMDRCNLTVLEVPGQEDLAQFLACEEVEITASMPCYLEDNVDRQRGKGVFEGSMRGLQRLNKLGYGRAETGLVLNLVYNPQGPSLPPSQETLEADYKRVLGERYGIEFNRLYTLANMPIQRFGAILVAQGRVRPLHRSAAPRSSRRQSRARDVPKSHLRRLAGLCLRLRFQPDAGFAARTRWTRARRTSRTCSTPRSRASRSGLPATATDAPPARGRVAAARSERRRSEARRLHRNATPVAGRRGCPTSAANSSCRRLCTNPAKTIIMSKLSIIMPVLNEGEGIAAALDALSVLRSLGTEVMVVDGGSRDATIQRARLRADRVIAAPPGVGCK